MFEQAVAALTQFKTLHGKLPDEICVAGNMPNEIVSLAMKYMLVEEAKQREV